MKLKESWESASFVNVNELVHVRKRWRLLPSERVSLSPAFTHVGIDFEGPLFVRGSASSAKAYICIFTCASSRMTHLELTGDLSTNEFFQAFIRMISRRGLCSTIWSDNAKTFKRADHEIPTVVHTRGHPSIINCGTK